jgi:hypothetical protein
VRCTVADFVLLPLIAAERTGFLASKMAARGCKLFLCKWHLLGAWLENLIKYVDGGDRKGMIDDLRKIVNAEARAAYCTRPAAAHCATHAPFLIFACPCLAAFFTAQHMVGGFSL